MPMQSKSFRPGRNSIFRMTFFWTF